MTIPSDKARQNQDRTNAQKHDTTVGDGLPLARRHAKLSTEELRYEPDPRSHLSRLIERLTDPFALDLESHDNSEWRAAQALAYQLHRADLPITAAQVLILEYLVQVDPVTALAARPQRVPRQRLRDVVAKHLGLKGDALEAVIDIALSGGTANPWLVVRPQAKTIANYVVRGHDPAPEDWAWARRPPGDVFDPSPRDLRLRDQHPMRRDHAHRQAVRRKWLLPPILLTIARDDQTLADWQRYALQELIRCRSGDSRLLREAACLLSCGQSGSPPDIHRVLERERALEEAMLRDAPNADRRRI